MEHPHVSPKATLAYLAAMLIMVGTLLTWNMNERYRDFEAYQAKLMSRSVSGAAGELIVSIRELHRSLQLFADSNAELLSALAIHPEDTTLHDRINQAMRTRFSEAFSFTIADKHGKPLVEDFDGLIGDVCLKDLRQFATDRAHSKIYIHPQPSAYHYDIMVDWEKDGSPQGIFFVSISADSLASVLKNGQIPGHKLMLLNSAIPNLIEVTEGGARINLKREYNLTPEEMRRIGYTLSVQGTGWNLVDLPDAGLFAEARREMRNEALFFFLMFAAAAGFMAIILHFSHRRNVNLERICMHDPVTGLPNRYFLLDRLQMLINRSQRESRQFALLLIDIGTASSKNQTYFDRKDTQLLKQAGERIGKHLSAGDLVARLSGNEFAVLLNSANKERAVTAVQAIKTALRLLDGDIAWPQPSVGISAYPDDCKSVDELIQRANLALHADRRWSALKPGQATN